MNKNDIKLLVFVSIFCLILIFTFNIFSKKGTKALVYYDGNLIKTIDLSINGEYVVNGYNGEVVIKVLNNKISVLQEDSPLHLCSKQGYINLSHESIVCLPNKIVINIDDNLLDAVVK